MEVTTEVTFEVDDDEIESAVQEGIQTAIRNDDLMSADEVRSHVEEQIRDEMISEERIEEIAQEAAREEAGSNEIDWDAVASQLNSVTELEGSACSLGRSFRDAVQKVLKWDSTQELLSESVTAFLARAEAVEEPPVVNAEGEPVMTLHVIRRGLTDGTLIHCSVTKAQAQGKASRTGEHGVHCVIEVPLSALKARLAGETAGESRFSRTDRRHERLDVYAVDPEGPYRLVLTPGDLSELAGPVQRFVDEHAGQTVTQPVVSRPVLPFLGRALTDEEVQQGWVKMILVKAAPSGELSGPYVSMVEEGINGWLSEHSMHGDYVDVKVPLFRLNQPVESVLPDRIGYVRPTNCTWGDPRVQFVPDGEQMDLAERLHEETGIRWSHGTMPRRAS